jgi:hypothetical protein
MATLNTGSLFAVLCIVPRPGVRANYKTDVAL